MALCSFNSDEIHSLFIHSYEKLKLTKKESEVLSTKNYLIFDKAKLFIFTLKDEVCIEKYPKFLPQCNSSFFK